MHRIGRKRFLGALGTSAGAIAVDPGHVARASALRDGGPERADRFGRMFRLPPFGEPTPRVEAALRELGEPGGVLDAVEFQGAAYRMGHSMVRPSYRANLAGDGGQPFFAFIFDPGQEGATDPDDLRGGCRSPRRFVGWQTFFDFGDGEVRPNKRIDTKISTPLFRLPLGAIASHDPPTALPQRNLLRHLTWQLPSGQLIARAMGVRPPEPSQLRELAGLGSYLSAQPDWRPTLAAASPSFPDDRLPRVRRRRPVIPGSISARSGSEELPGTGRAGRRRSRRWNRSRRGRHRMTTGVHRADV